MATEPILTQADLGRRIALAREDSTLTQADLAKALGVDRTAIAKIESGSRKVSATELVAIAGVLQRPIDWFVTESPPAVISRRRDEAVGGRSRPLDVQIERLGRDVEFLLNQDVLQAARRRTFNVPQDLAAAEQLAAAARVLMQVPDGPLLDLQRLTEPLGLLAFALELGTDAGDAAYVEVADLGVALINGSVEPGRRRFNLAHEFGHHLVGDAYAPETAIGGTNETERVLNAFAAHLLMPRASVKQTWDEIAGRDHRLAAIAVAVRFRTSWTATCSHLNNLQIIDSGEHKDLINTPPRGGDFLELGEWWVAELDPPSIPPDYGRRVVGAYRSGKLTAARSVELLWATVSEDELPDINEIPLDGLRREFDPLP